jgi:hypothetical protein
MTFQILYDFLKLSISIAFLYVSLQRGKNVRIRLTSANPYITYTICNVLPILISCLVCVLSQNLYSTA